MLSYSGIFLESEGVGSSGWTGFAVGNPATVPGGAGTGFAFNLATDGSYQAWNNGALVASGSIGYNSTAKIYTLEAIFNEMDNSVELTYSDATTNIVIGTFPTAFAYGARFIELRNHVDTSSADGIVDMRYDELSIDILASQTLYPEWAQDHGLSTTSALLSADTDGDGLDNLAEYALGTDPNVSDADATGITAEFSLATITYTYPRRFDAAGRGLEYELAYKISLTDSDWLPLGYSFETGTNSIDPEFEAITNEIGIDGIPQAFLHLEIRVP